MAIPAVRQAIKEKQKAIIEASGAKIGRHLTKIDVVARLSNWPNYRQSAPDTISWAN
jgi:hypothetical protein